jgi:hypothetical protein
MAAVLDLTFSLTLGSFLARASAESQVVVLNFDQEHPSRNSWVFNVHTSNKAHAGAILAVLNHYGWTAAAVVTSPTSFGLETSVEVELGIVQVAKILVTPDEALGSPEHQNTGGTDYTLALRSFCDHQSFA